jgi:hypothetical protein
LNSARPIENPYTSQKSFEHCHAFWQPLICAHFGETLRSNQREAAPAVNTASAFVREGVRQLNLEREL